MFIAAPQEEPLRLPQQAARQPRPSQPKPAGKLHGPLLIANMKSHTQADGCKQNCCQTRRFVIVEEGDAGLTCVPSWLRRMACMPGKLEGVVDMAASRLLLARSIVASPLAPAPPAAPPLPFVAIARGLLHVQRHLSTATAQGNSTSAILSLHAPRGLYQGD